MTTTRKSISVGCVLTALTVVAAVAVPAGFTPAARADEQGAGAPPAPVPAAGHQKLIKVCKADIAKLCPDASSGGGDGAVASCLAAKKSDIGKPCLRALRHARQVSRFRQACGDDVGRLCAGIKPGAGRIMSCLKAAGETLSPACKERVARVGARADKAGQAAAPEAADTPAIADEAVKEEQQAVPVLPDSVQLDDQPPSAAAPAPAPAPAQ